MIEMVQLVALFAFAAPFLLYPGLLCLRAAWAPAPIAGGDVQPTVDLIIAAHDEAASIDVRLENALALDYPPERLRIWVASDGSTDGTVEIARRRQDDRVRVLDLPRQGKAAALTAAVEASATEPPGAATVLAFSDANSQWQADALRELVRPFADPAIGGVAGDQRYASPADAGETGPGDEGTQGERSYWSFDRRLKRWQSRAGNVISATGAIYAIRRELFEPPPPDATDDFMISTAVIAQGRRLVFCEAAVAIEPPADAAGGELRRKVRILTRGLRAVLYRRALMSPSKTGLYALELFVHKLWRRLVWIPFAVLLATAPPALAAGGPGAALAGGVLAGTGLGVIGLVRSARRTVPVPADGRRPTGLLRAMGRRLTSIAAYVLMVQLACARATLDVLRGRRVATWEPERAAVARAEGAP